MRRLCVEAAVIHACPGELSGCASTEAHALVRAFLDAVSAGDLPEALLTDDMTALITTADPFRSRLKKLTFAPAKAVRKSSTAKRDAAGAARIRPHPPENRTYRSIRIALAAAGHSASMLSGSIVLTY